MFGVSATEGEPLDEVVLASGEKVSLAALMKGEVFLCIQRSDTIRLKY